MGDRSFSHGTGMENGMGSAGGLRKGAGNTDGKRHAENWTSSKSKTGKAVRRTPPRK